MVTSDKIDFKKTKVPRDEDGDFIMTKEIYIKKTYRSLLNMYTPNQGYIKQLLTEVKGETDKNTVIVGELNIPLTALDRSSKQKINIEILVLYDTLYHMDIIDI